MSVGDSKLLRQIIAFMIIFFNHVGQLIFGCASHRILCDSGYPISVHLVQVTGAPSGRTIHQASVTEAND